MIGRQPNLLARISSRIADNDSYEEPDRTPSPAVGLSHSMASGSNDVGPTRSRPTLLQALGGHDIEMSEPQEASFLNGGFDQSVSLGMAADDFSTAPIAMPLSTFKPTARVAVSTPANRSISYSKPQQASTSSGVSKTTVQPSASRLTPTSASPKATPRTTQVSNPYIVVPSPTGNHLASQTPPSSIDAASTNSMVICPPDPEDPSLMTLRGLQVRLMSTLANLSPVNTSDALRLANSAKEQCSAVMTVAHRSHALARQALAAAQESMDAAQECVEAAQSIQLRVDEAVEAVQTISSGLGLAGGQEREWNDHLKSMQGDLHQLARWASEREVQDARRQREAEEREKQLDQQKIALASIPRHIDPAPTISVTADSNLVSSKTFIGHSITALSTHALSVEDEADAATRAWKQSMKEANERKRHAEEEVHRKRDDELRLEREHKKAQEDAAARQVAFENARAERERAEEEERVRRQEAAQEVQKRREQIQKQQEEVRRFNLSQQKQKEEVDRKLTEEREKARREEEEKEARMLAQERKRREQEEQQRLTAKSQEDADAKRREEQERLCRRNLDDMHASAGQATNLPQSLAKHMGPTNSITPSTSTSTALPLNANSSASPNVASSQPLRRQDTGNSVAVDASRSEGLGDVVPISRSSASPLSAMGSTVANRAPLPTRQPPVGHTARYGASSTRDNTRVHDLPKIQNDGKSSHLPDTGGQVFNGPASRQSYTRGSPVLPGVVADRSPTPSTQTPQGILGAPDEITTHSEGTDIGNVTLLPLSQITPISPETRRVNIHRIMLSRNASNGPVIKQEPEEQMSFIKEEESSEPVMLEKRKANWVSQDLIIKKLGMQVGPPGSKSKTAAQPSPNATAVPNISPPPPYNELSVAPAQNDVSTLPANEQPIVPTNSARPKHPSVNKPSDALFLASSSMNGTVNALAPQVGSASTAQRASPNVLLAGRGASGSTAPPQSSALPSITITRAITPVKPVQDNLGSDTSTTGGWLQLMALHRDIREQSLNFVDHQGRPADSRVHDRHSPSPPRSPQYSPRSPNFSPSPSPPLGYQGVPRNSQLLYKPSPPRQRLPPPYKGRNNSPGLSRPRPSGSRGVSPTFRAHSPRSLEHRRSVSRELVPPPIVGQKRLRDDEQGAPPPRRSRYGEHARENRPSEQITTSHSYQDEWSRAADYGRSPSPESLQIPLALRMDSGPSTDTASRPSINKRPPPNNYRPNYNRPSHGDDSHRPPRYNSRNDDNDSRPGLLSRFTDSAPLPPPGQGYQYTSGPTRSRPPRPSGRGGGRGGHGLEHRISSNSQSLFNRLQNEA